MTMNEYSAVTGGAGGLASEPQYYNYYITIYSNIRALTRQISFDN